MKVIQKATSSLFVVCLLLLHTPLRASSAVSSKDFAGPDQTLTEEEAALYIMHRDKLPVSKFLNPGELTIDLKRAVVELDDKLDDIRSKTGAIAPWKWEDIDLAFPSSTPKKEPSWRNIRGFTKELELGKDGKGGKMGPFRLRQTPEDLVLDVSEAKGATIGFSNNRLIDGNGAWNTQGVLDYPIGLRSFVWGKDLVIGPAAQWHSAEAEEAGKDDVEELSLMIPFTLYSVPKGRTTSSLWVFQGKPYFNTDFSWEHQIFGVEASAEYVGNAFNNKLLLGGFQNLGLWGIQYQLRVLPKVDYSETSKAGRHTTRVEGDDWFRAGGMASLDFRLGGETFSPLDLGASYQFFEALSGDGGFSKLIKSHVTWWLSDYAGVTFKYEVGETPIADKDIDLLTLGLEFKF